MMQIAVLGSLNIDLVTQVERFPHPGETIVGRSFQQFTGGKGANQAVACGRLGAVVCMFGAVGKDVFAEKLLETLKESNVDTDAIHVCEDAGTGVAHILVDDQGENAIAIIAGSIFAIGHDHHQRVSELSIPIPVISKNKNLGELNSARTLQVFQDITGGRFGQLEIPRAGLEYLAAQGPQKTGKLHFCWGQHFQEFEASHGWCDLDLSNPRPLEFRKDSHW